MCDGFGSQAHVRGGGRKRHCFAIPEDRRRNLLVSFFHLQKPIKRARTTGHMALKASRLNEDPLHMDMADGGMLAHQPSHIKKSTRRAPYDRPHGFDSRSR